MTTGRTGRIRRHGPSTRRIDGLARLVATALVVALAVGCTPSAPSAAGEASDVPASAGSSLDTSPSAGESGSAASRSPATATTAQQRTHPFRHGHASEG
jgi:hypothetical protein